MLITNPHFSKTRGKRTPEEDFRNSYSPNQKHYIKDGTDIDWAWLAGFYEGEGSCIHIIDKRYPNSRGSFTIQIPQKNKEPLLKAIQFTGGQITKETNYVSYCYRLRITSNYARRVILRIYHLLSVEHRKQSEKLYFYALDELNFRLKELINELTVSS